MKEPRLVYIEWLDATTEDGWKDHSELKAHVIKSVGWLMKETKEEVVLAADYSFPDTNRRIAIPLGWVKNRKFL